MISELHSYDSFSADFSNFRDLSLTASINVTYNDRPQTFDKWDVTSERPFFLNEVSERPQGSGRRSRTQNEIASFLNDIMPGPSAYVTMIFPSGAITPVETKVIVAIWSHQLSTRTQSVSIFPSKIPLQSIILSKSSPTTKCPLWYKNV